MAEILTIKRDKLPSEWLETEKATSLCYEELNDILNNIDADWIERAVAEEDSSYKQLIPYAVAIFGDNIGCYKRSGDEKRLHDLYSIGAGGHIDREDDKGSIIGTLESGLARELSEEFADFNNEKAEIEFAGIINEDNTPVGSVHLGCVFKITLSEEVKAGEELTGFEWVNREVLKNRNLEHWSRLALELI